MIREFSVEKLNITNPALDDQKVWELMKLGPKLDQLSPLPLVVSIEDRLFVLDGNHRIQAMRNLNLTSVVADFEIRTNDYLMSDDQEFLRRFR